MLDEQDSKDMKLLRLMGQERRFEVLLLLCREEMSHEEICLALGKPMGVYKHLKAMVDAGLLIRTDITRRDVRYRANPKVLEELSLCLTEMSIDAYEITYRAAQAGTRLGKLAEAEHATRMSAAQLKEQYESTVEFGQTYGRKPEDLGLEGSPFEDLSDDDKDRLDEHIEEIGQNV